MWPRRSGQPRPNPPLLTQTNMVRRRRVTLSCQRWSQAPGRTTRFVPCRSSRDATGTSRETRTAAKRARFFCGFRTELRTLVLANWQRWSNKPRTDDVPRLNPESERRRARYPAGAGRDAARLGGCCLRAGASVYKRAPHQRRGGRHAVSPQGSGAKRKRLKREQRAFLFGLWVG